MEQDEALEVRERRGYMKNKLPEVKMVWGGSVADIVSDCDLSAVNGDLAIDDFILLSGRQELKLVQKGKESGNIFFETNQSEIYFEKTGRTPDKRYKSGFRDYTVTISAPIRVTRNFIVKQAVDK